MNGRGRLTLLGVAMTGMAAAALRLLRSRRSSALDMRDAGEERLGSWSTHYQRLKEVVSAMDVIDEVVAEGGRRKAEGGRRKAEGGRRKAEGGRRKAAGLSRSA
jgi:hypothetical protein